ncbi:MAG: EutN/CcmL family microcompartment protein [Rhodothermales bacterium]|nr:EutN/CcmL family microcompartment protein [Rhodothermales bacterium]MBO6778399.1 EutN/CcmL family microcompartment protein [Rhodothermales bacterium]
MNLGKVIGRVWATQKVDTLEGRRLLVVQPLTFDREEAGAPLIALDTVDSGDGDHVIYVSSTEATIPFKPALTPTDATIVGVVDRVDNRGASWTAT